VPIRGRRTGGSEAILRLVGAVFLILGALVLGTDILAAGEGPFRLSALGEWWFWLHPDSLQLLQPAIERHLSPSLWDPGVQTLLEWPLAAELFGLAGLCFVAAAIRRR
jgi:hypothetical protein